MDQTDYITRRSFGSAGRNHNLFLWIDMSFWSQFFAERSAHKDELDLFLAFCVQFQEGDINDSEQTKRILDN